MAVGLNANQLINKVVLLLREEGYAQDPSTAPTIASPADFSYATILSDLNFAQQYFMGDTGYAPRLLEKRVVLPISAGLDYTLPADLISLERLEYLSPFNASNQALKLIPLSFDDFDNVTINGWDLSDIGAPEFYRRPFGSGSSVTVRFAPQPGYVNAGVASGAFGVGGSPAAGDTVTLTITNPVIPATQTVPYTVLVTDTAATIATALAALINPGGLVSAQASSSGITITALAAGTLGNFTSISAATTGGTVISPSVPTLLSGGGTPDSLILYYTSLGTTMIAGTDYPGIPAPFHIALAYFVLKDYWRRKDDPDGQADRYQRDYEHIVARAKAFPIDSDYASTPSFVDDDSDLTLFRG